MPRFFQPIPLKLRANMDHRVIVLDFLAIDLRFRLAINAIIVSRQV